MWIGVPREILRNEHRVGLTPFGASKLSPLCSGICVEHDAGADSHWSDQDYAEAGAEVVFSSEEVYKRAGLVCRIGTLHGEEVEALQPGSVVCGFLHLAVASREQVERLIEKKVTLIGYEIIERAGSRPILAAMSEIAGLQSVHTAAHLLEHRSGGRGLLLGGIPGIPPPTVVVLGAGKAGRAAARLSLATGAHVILLDEDVDQVRRAHAALGHSPVTAASSERNLKRFTAIADVLVGAVATRGGRSPYLATEAMVSRMKPGSVIIDLAIDQGGCVATSRPTTLEDPTFQVHGVTHYCVPNMTAAVPRTASRAATLAALPHLLRLVQRGVEQALAEDQGLARGVYLYRGHVVNEHVARVVGEGPEALEGLLANERRRPGHGMA